MKVQSAMVLATLVMGGCSGTRVKEADAVDHFRTHRQQYEAIIAAVDRCRPVRNGPSPVSSSPLDNGGDPKLRCERSGQAIRPIADALRRAGAVRVMYETVDSPSLTAADSELTSVSIAVFAAGLSVSGLETEFVYSVRPLSQPPRSEGDAGRGADRKAVTGAPYHWYWEESWT